MSIGCGTLGGVTGYAKGTSKAASSNGRQHSLPTATFHQRISADDVESHWSVGNQHGTTRVWGESRANRLGGYERVDGEPNGWTKGEFWNTDSNINIWNEHQIRRNHAESSHDIHRHDQMRRIVLPQHPGEKERPPRLCVSGVISPDSNFMEAWGFDLGLRDRHARPLAKPFLPVRGGEQFRSVRSFKHDMPRVLEDYRTLKRQISEPRTRRSTLRSQSSVQLSAKLSAMMTLRPDDPEALAEAAKAGAGASTEEESRFADPGGIGGGRCFGSKSCRGWDSWDHVVKREAARTTHDIMSPFVRQHREGYPFVDEVDLRPSAVYTRRYQRFGEENLRRHESRAKQVRLT